MLRPAADRLVVVELDLDRNPHQRVDVALFDPYGDPQGGLGRVRSLVSDERVGCVAVYAWQVVAEHVDAFLSVGARAVLAKSAPPEAIADALLAIDDGAIIVHPSFGPPGERTWPGHDAGLSERESEVAALLSHGLSNREIAQGLFISEHTVKSHLKAIFHKTGAASRGQAIARILGDTGFRHVDKVG
jgi:DNA-binding NarL/FixJ family response regulator